MSQPVYWIGHQTLGDVVGFCAAAYLYAEKIQHRVQVSFHKERQDIVNYFDCLDYISPEQLKQMDVTKTDCGIDPTIDQWPTMNGVKRFYRFMDHALTTNKSFDIYFNRTRLYDNSLIGLITCSNTQGDIPNNITDNLIKEASILYPNHKIIAIGNFDNSYIPQGVIDMRQQKGDINWIINMIQKLDLLITPQSGPCFIAAGFRIPMWVYRSKESFWDNVLNYDTYKVEKWVDRVEQSENVFDTIYSGGGWDGKGSGPGSLPENNKEYLYLLHKIIEYTPSIKTIVDVGCGDYRLMKELIHTKKYIGVDVSSHIIQKNKTLYPHVDFSVGSTVGELPDGDIIIIKDVLQHLSNKDVMKSLNNIKKYKYAIITNDYTGENVNYDINNGQWRPINILLSPYNVDGVTLYGYNGKHVVLIRN